jgi:hypothetical protein
VDVVVVAALVADVAVVGVSTRMEVPVVALVVLVAAAEAAVKFLHNNM